MSFYKIIMPDIGFLSSSSSAHTFTYTVNSHWLGCFILWFRPPLALKFTRNNNWTITIVKLACWRFSYWWTNNLWIFATGMILFTPFFSRKTLLQNNIASHVILDWKQIQTHMFNTERRYTFYVKNKSQLTFLWWRS
jgi:hypothetical protein